MSIEGIIWLRAVVDKLAFKHQVESHEVEELLAGEPKFRYVEKGSVKVRMCTWLSGRLMRADT